MKKVVLFFVAICIAIISFSQNKLAPAFEYLRYHYNNNDVETPELFKLQTVDVFNNKTATLDKKYFCIIYTTNPTYLVENGIEVQSILPKFVTALISFNQLQQLVKMEDVKYIDAPKLIMPSNDISVGTSGASLLHNGNLNNTNYKGDGVIVGIYDTGIDWKHFDFRNPSDTTKTRILKVWDHTLTPITGEVSPSGFSYGVEYSQTQINNEIDGTPAGFVREKDINGHGTHVTGTAAGNGLSLASKKYSGIAPNADIVVVKGGDNFFNYSSQIDAMTYFKNVANFYGKPLVINMSIGGQFGAHDGTAPNEIAVDDFSASANGRVVVIAAGNDNGKTLHKQVSMSSNSTSNIVINVPTTSGTAAVDLFQLSLYVNDTSTMIATVTDPNGGTITANINQNLVLPAMSNNATVYLDNEIDIESGDRLINLYISRKTKTTNASGNWTLTLTNTSNNNIIIDGWLNYKGSDYGGTSVIGSDGNYQVHSPGCANSAITVASFVGKLDWYSNSTTSPGGYAYSGTQQDNISSFSSIGPRRDNVLKPTIAANGQGVVSCTSSNSGAGTTSTSVVVPNVYHILAGTSMATPEVTGCVALLLQVKNSSSYNEIKNAITTTATRDVFTTNSSNPIWGSGKIDVFKAASSLINCQPYKRVTLSYDSSTTSATNPSYSLGALKAATKFTATINGKLGGVFFKTGTSVPATSFAIEIRTNNVGFPGNLLGSSNIPPSYLSKFSWNYFDISSLNVQVQNQQDYFVVLIPGGSDSWSLGYENLSNSNRSFYSNGSGWTASNDLRIRSVIIDSSLPTSASVTNLSICSSQLPFSWNGLTFNNADTQTKTGLTNAFGCDSSATLILTVKSTSSSTTSININSNQLPFYWNGLTFNMGGSQTAHLSNAVGCDSAITLILSVNSSLPLVISGVNNLCAGTTSTLSANIGGGTWSSLNNRATINNFGTVTGVNAGNAIIYYTVNGAGVTKTATYNITVNAIPNIPSIAYEAGTVNPQRGAPAGGYCIGKTFNVVGTPVGGIWSSMGSISVTMIGNVSINTTGAGSLTYTYTNSNGCLNSRTINGFGYTCAAREALIENEPINNTCDFSIFPNPSKSILNLNIDMLDGAGTIVISDIYGKKLKTKNSSLGLNVINISDVSSGIYFITLKTDLGTKTKKIIVTN